MKLFSIKFNFSVASKSIKGLTTPFSKALSATNVLIVEPGGYNPEIVLFVNGLNSSLIRLFQYFFLNHEQTHLAQK